MHSYPLVRGRILHATASLACLIGGALPVSAELIYEDNFSGLSAEHLVGKAPSLRTGTQGGSASATWIGPLPSHDNRIYADGRLEMPVVYAVGASAFLPFIPSPGMIYKLTVSGIDVPTGAWVGAGFSTATAPNGEVRFRDTDPVFWSLARNEVDTLSDQTFSGPGITGGENSSSFSASEITIVIDTTGTNAWTVTWFLDGHSVRTGRFSPLPIKNVGFGFNAAATGVAGFSSVTSFTLEASLPGVDEDRDLLPDAWELVHFPGAAGDAPSVSLRRYDGSSDPDSDGFTNGEEFVGGSDPLKSQSTPLDLNGDGLPDSWQKHSFGALAGAQILADADPDHDGYTNQQEREGRSNPMDRRSLPTSKQGPVPKAAATFNAGRNGTDVFLAWELPPSGVAQQTEIYRNVSEAMKGRILVASVSSATTRFLDQVPDSKATYWYWLSVPAADGKAINHGPFSTQPVEVWQP